MKRQSLTLWLIVALGAVLRWHQIGLGSLWIDEGGSITLARMPWGPFLRTLWQYEANMSFYYVLLRGWMHLGDSEAVVRSLSAALGTASIALLYVLGRRLFSSATALIAAALLSVHMFHVWFSQEARGYPLAILLVILSLLFFVEAAETPANARAWVLYVAVTALAVYAHFFAALILVAEWLSLGPRRLGEIGKARVAAILVALALLLLPLGAFVLLHDQGQIDWVPPLSAANIFFTVLGVCGFNPLTLVLVLVGLWWALRPRSLEDGSAWRLRLLGISFAFPIVVVALASPVKHLFFFRYFAICIPPAVLLAARVLTPVRELSRVKRVAVASLAGLTVALGLWATVGYYGRLRNWGGDWRAATEYVLSNRQAGDGVLFHVSAGLDAYRYYVNRLPSRGTGVPLPTVVFPAADELASAHVVPSAAALKDANAGHPRLWLVLHQKDATALPASFLEPFVLVKEKNFTGSVPDLSLRVALYRLKPSS